MEKLKRLEERYTVKSIWECEWKAMKKQDPQMRAIVRTLKRVDPLEPREAKPTHRVPKGKSTNWQRVRIKTNHLPKG